MKLLKYIPSQPRSLLGFRAPQSKKIENISHGYIFVHIPKNAGSSVADALGIETSYHYTAQSYRDILGKSSYDNRFSFAFVRNPWDRFLSLYRYARLDESRYHSAIDPESAPHGKHEDYDLLCDATVEDCARHLREGRLQHDDFINHWRPQSDWLTDEEGNVIVDYVGRVETINDDFQTVANRLNLPVDMLPVVNSSKDSTVSTSSSDTVTGYQSAFTDEARSIVTEYYREDIERWGYAF